MSPPLRPGTTRFLILRQVLPRFRSHFSPLCEFPGPFPPRTEMTVALAGIRTFSLVLFSRFTNFLLRFFCISMPFNRCHCPALSQKGIFTRFSPSSAIRVVTIAIGFLRFSGPADLREGSVFPFSLTLVLRGTLDASLVLPSLWNLNDFSFLVLSLEAQQPAIDVFKVCPRFYTQGLGCFSPSGPGWVF